MSRRPLPRDPRALAALALVILVILLLSELGRGPERRPLPTAPPPAVEGYLLCCWNVENLYDDEDDPRNPEPDERWFAEDPVALRLKHDLLVEALLRLNGGRGPDILAISEVENRRAVELLVAALNDRISAEWHYTEVVHDDNRTGRKIEPALITRLPVDPERTRTFDGFRLISATLVAEGRPLHVTVGHWTSRVTDPDGGRRLKYARAAYEAYLEVERLGPGPDDVVICGDFNDEPDDPSIGIGLRATGDREAVIESVGTDRPRLLNLLSGRDPERSGTYLYRKQWRILDHIVVSAGLLDEDGWAVVPDSLRVVDDVPLGPDGGPLRFGDQSNARPRGPSDHLAVVVRLVLPGVEPEVGSDDLASR